MTNHDLPHRAKLTADQRERIKRLYAEGATAGELALQFKVSADYIRKLAGKRARKY